MASSSVRVARTDDERELLTAVMRKNEIRLRSLLQKGVFPNVHISEVF